MVLESVSFSASWFQWFLWFSCFSSSVFHSFAGLWPLFAGRLHRLSAMDLAAGGLVVLSPKGQELAAHSGPWLSYRSSSSIGVPTERMENERLLVKMGPLMILLHMWTHTSTSWDANTAWKARRSNTHKTLKRWRGQGIGLTLTISKRHNRKTLQDHAANKSHVSPRNLPGNPDVLVQSQRWDTCATGEMSQVEPN